MNRIHVRARIVGVLALLVALNAAFVVTITWAYLTLIPHILIPVLAIPFGGGEWGPIFALPFEWYWYPVLIGGFLAAQIWYGYRSVLGDVWTGTVEQEDRPELHALVTRLASTADIPAPSIAIVDSDVPNCFTVGSVTNATIVVTEPLLAALDESELETVLAHEIAHVKNRDVTLMTIASLFISIADSAYQTVLLLPRALTGREELSTRERIAADWLIPVLLLSAVFVAPLIWLFPVVSRIVNGQLANQREFAADRGAAEITGKPLTLARALIQLHEGSPTVAETDLRRNNGGTQSLCFMPYDVATCSLAGTREDDREPSWNATDVDAEPRSWLDDAGSTEEHPVTGTHPPVEDRVRRLVELAGEQND